MEEIDDLDILRLEVWAVPLDEPPAEAEATVTSTAPAEVPPPRIWSGPEESAGSLFRPRHDDEALPPNGSFFRLRKRGDAA